MIRHDVPAGSDEWRKARLGIPTASQFHRIITPAKLQLSKSRTEYMHELIAERLTGRWDDDDAGGYRQRGHDLEPEAIAYYDFQSDAETVGGGFCTTDDGRVGCSPDRLVLADGKVVRGLEIKCPSPKVHAGYLLSNSHRDEYRLQVQGQMFVCGLPSWDLMSYHPDMPPALIQVDRDEAVMRVLDAFLADFCAELDEMHKRALAMRGDSNQPDVNW